MRSLVRGCRRQAAAGGTADLRTKILDFRGFDSSILLISRAGMLMSNRQFPGKSEATNLSRESLSREIVRTVHTHVYIYIYTHVCIHAITCIHMHIYIYIERERDIYIYTLFECSLLSGLPDPRRRASRLSESTGEGKER